MFFRTYGLTEDSTGKHRIRGPGVEGNQDSDGRYYTESDHFLFINSKWYFL